MKDRPVQLLLGSIAHRALYFRLMSILDAKWGHVSIGVALTGDEAVGGGDRIGVVGRGFGVQEQTG